MPGSTSSKLSFRDVEFSYPNGLPVLKSFSTEVHKGEFVAVTGASGIGKSTMLMLAFGMEDPQHGTVEVEYSGAAQRVIKASHLASGTFVYVPQGNMLMSGSIRGTVTFADRPGTEGLSHTTSKLRGQTAEQTSYESQSMDEKQNEALYIACADKFVDDIPNGIETILGEGGRAIRRPDAAPRRSARGLLRLTRAPARQTHLSP